MVWNKEYKVVGFGHAAGVRRCPHNCYVSWFERWAYLDLSTKRVYGCMDGVIEVWQV